MNSRHAPILLILLLSFLPAHGADSQAQPATNPLDILAAKRLYYPRPYEQADIDEFLKSGGTRLDYKTDQGNQTAWLITPAGEKKVERLWLVCGGNGVVALEMAPFCRGTKLDADAFVLLDYPGYGCCEGLPSPRTVRENVKHSIMAAGKKVGIDPLKNPEQICVFGHSLGCAAALLGVEEFHLRSAVLCSPFTSTHEMAERQVGLAKDAPFSQQFDNRLGLKELQQTRGTAWIIHGSDDEIIPVEMSKTMADEFRDVVKLSVIANAGHNDILYTASQQVLDAMRDARKIGN